MATPRLIKKLYSKAAQQKLTSRETEIMIIWRESVDAQAENKRLREALELKSYDLYLPGNNSGRKPAYCCSLCGHKPHTVACVYGQALQEQDK